MSTKYANSFHPKMNVKTKVITKKVFQGMLKELRRNGFAVSKTEDKAGYIVQTTTPKGSTIMVLKAMNGHSGYLARYEEKLLNI